MRNALIWLGGIILMGMLVNGLVSTDSDGVKGITAYVSPTQQAQLDAMEQP